MRAALIQLNSLADPAENLPVTLGYIREAAAGGAGFVLTPECTNMMSSHKAQQASRIYTEADDPTLAALRAEAKSLGIWLLIGSIGIRTEEAGDGRYANRSYMIGPDGEIKARYDKIHMYDVDVNENEVYRESASYRPGEKAVVVDTPFGRVGMSICYDLRFPYLFRDLAHAGATILTIPAAFNHITGAAHWHVLMRARAIENGVWVLAPAQTGKHPGFEGSPDRLTYGHSVAVAPWGEVAADAGTAPGVTFVEIDAEAVEKARARVPSIRHDRPYDGP